MSDETSPPQRPPNEAIPGKDFPSVPPWPADASEEAMRRWTAEAVSRVAEWREHKELEASKQDLAVFAIPTTRLFEYLGKHLLPISVVLYGVGFVVSVHHFTRSGVPVAAVGHAQFVGAAILATFFIGAPLLQGRYFARKGLLRSILGLLATLLVAGWHCWSQGIAPFPVLFFWLLVVVVGWAWRRLAEWSSNVPVDGSPADRVAQPALMGLLALLSFAALVYPNLPQWMGGGQPRLVSIRWSSPEATPPEVAPRQGVCPSLYEVMADSDFVYLIVSELPAPAAGCSAPGLEPIRRWAGMLAAQNLKHLVVPRANVALLSYSDPPPVYGLLAR